MGSNTPGRSTAGDFHAYSKVTRRVWFDRRFRALSKAPPNGQTLWLRLLTGPELGPVPGLIRIGEAALAESLGWSVEGFREAFREVFAEGLAKADWEAGLVWLPKAIVHNEPASPNVVIGWWRELGSMPECPLLDEATGALFLNLSARGKAWEDAFAKAFAKAFGKPFDIPSPKPLANQEQEQEQDQERESARCAHAREESIEVMRPELGGTDLDRARLHLVRGFQARFEQHMRYPWPGHRRSPDPSDLAAWMLRVAAAFGGTADEAIDHALDSWFAEEWPRKAKFPWKAFCAQAQRYFDAAPVRDEQAEEAFA